jgi:hypothetical protein
MAIPAFRQEITATFRDYKERLRRAVYDAPLVDPADPERLLMSSKQAAAAAAIPVPTLDPQVIESVHGTPSDNGRIVHYLYPVENAHMLKYRSSVTMQTFGTPEVDESVHGFLRIAVPATGREGASVRAEAIHQARSALQYIADLNHQINGFNAILENEARELFVRRFGEEKRRREFESQL